MNVTTGLPLPASVPLATALEYGVAAGAARAKNLSAARDLLRHALRPSRLARLEATYAPAYKSAKPFPHTVIDNLLPAPILEWVNAELPESYYTGKDGRRVEGCTSLIPLSTKRRTCTHLKGREERKSALQHEDDMGPVTVLTFRALKSTEFTAFLTRLTGIERSLYPDPEYMGMGVQMIAPGGMLGLREWPRLPKARFEA